jgi:hypothetical protein
MAARYQIIDNLNKRFINLSAAKPFRHAVYRDGSRIVFHIQVPTETEETEFFWDVVIEVHSDNDNAKEILSSPVQVFSNNPSFVFTYAHVANNEKLLVTWLKTKLPSTVYSTAPDTRNPVQQMGFEKIIYFAAQWILSRRLYDQQVEPHEDLKVRAIAANIDSFADISTKYARLKKASAKARKQLKDANSAATAEEKKNLKNAIKKEANINSGRSLGKTSTRTKSVKKATSTRKVKSTKSH